MKPLMRTFFLVEQEVTTVSYRRKCKTVVRTREVSGVSLYGKVLWEPATQVQINFSVLFRVKVTP